MRRAIAPVVAALLAPATIQAQLIRIHVVTEGQRVPVAGAIVKLLDGSGVVRASALSNEAGRLILRASRGGAYRLRADRIGFVGLTSTPFAVPDTGAVAVDVEMPNQAVILAEISVRGTTRCGTDAANGAETAALWSEIKKALDATAIGKRSGLTFTMVSWRRNPHDGRDPTYERTDTVETAAPRPFSAISIDRLADSGYIIGDWHDWIYFGPDEETLLSSAFLTTHCFGLATTTAKGEHLRCGSTTAAESGCNGKRLRA